MGVGFGWRVTVTDRPEPQSISEGSSLITARLRAPAEFADCPGLSCRSVATVSKPVSSRDRIPHPTMVPLTGRAEVGQRTNWSAS